ncbi:hypothetical protein R1sor_015369 [Riccia sorocarpa]|uniref:NB-ARC domain-containing protein n=1 Tax=Riccia sorocarpa TaxID=122646 RepID=A0ABD3HFY1_9MARC
MAVPYPSEKQHNDSLYSLYSPTDPNAEFVFFHGIVREPCENIHIEAWTTSSGICWPAEWLHSERGLERAHIFSVNYDSSLIKRDDAGVFSMNNLTENLAQDLISCGNIGQKGLPVVLIGYDLGGLVIKALCVYLESEPVSREKGRMYGDFLKNVKGIFYFSTPHQGVEIVDGSDFDGELAEYAKLLNAKTAQMNGRFQKIRQARKWKTGGLGHLVKDQKGSIHLPEGTMRYDTDSFMMTAGTWETINKPDSPESSSFQFFLSNVRSFIKDHLKEEPNEEYEEFISSKVGLESGVNQVVSLFSSLEKAAGNVSAVVLHGMGGIGKSTLGDAVFLKLSKKFHPDCQCSVDRQAIVSPTRALSKLQKSILGSLMSGSKTDADRKIILKALKKCYRDAKHRLLIFIDNIENAKDLDDIFPDDENHLPVGSYILLASRNLEMCSKLQALKVRKVRSYAVQELDEFSARKLFLRNALIESSGTQQWRDVRNVLDVCSGLPLALEVTGAAVAGVHYTDWGFTLENLKNCLPLGGTKEDNLWGSLEFSYNLLGRDLQRVFLDIVFCFNGSPWNELKVLYGPSLGKLEQKALISKDKHRSLQFPTVKVHALFVALGEKEGKALGSHRKLNVKQDRDAGLGRGFSFLSDFLLGCFYFLSSYFLRRTVLPKRHRDDEELACRCEVLVLDGNASNFSYPDSEDPSTHLKLTRGKVQFRASRLRKCANSLRILILRDVIVCGMLGRDTVPENLECFICSNSNVPFRGGDLTSLQKLKHLEITTALDTNDSYKFPHVVRKVRLENKKVKRITFGARKGFDSSRRLEEFGLMSVTRPLLNTQVSQFKFLKKVVLRNISGLDNNLPEALFQMESLQSLSIQYCDHVSLLPDVDMGNLEHLHLALPALIRLPESLKSLRSLRSMTLDNCRLLRQLPVGIGTPLTPRLQLIAINQCPCLKTLPSVFHEVKKMKESESDVWELQLPSNGAYKWHYYTTDELDSMLVEDSLAATNMPPLIGQRRGNVYELLQESNPDLEVVFVHGLLRQGMKRRDAFWRTWKMRDSEVCWPAILLPQLLQIATSDGNVTQYKPRVLSVAYENKPDLGPDEKGNVMPENLINDIIFDAGVGQRGVPVFFVGHDFGGILIKQFVLKVGDEAAKADTDDKKQKLNSFLDNLKSVFFFCMPHYGVKAFDNLAAKLDPDANQMLCLMTMLYKKTSRINMEFQTYRRGVPESGRPRIRISTHVFHATHETHEGGFDALVVPEGSARNDADTFYCVNANHFTACQPETSASSQVRAISHEMIRVLKGR